MGGVGVYSTRRCGDVCRVCDFVLGVMCDGVLVILLFVEVENEQRWHFVVVGVNEVVVAAAGRSIGTEDRRALAGIAIARFYENGEKDEKVGRWSYPVPIYGGVNVGLEWCTEFGSTL